MCLLLPKWRDFLYKSVFRLFLYGNLSFSADICIPSSTETRSSYWMFSQKHKAYEKAIHTRCDQIITVILNFIKKFLFIYQYLVPFKATPLRFNTLMPAFFPILETLLKRAFWNRQQLLFLFFFYLINHNKMLSFHRCLQFWEEEKLSEGQVR